MSEKHPPPIKVIPPDNQTSGVEPVTVEVDGRPKVALRPSGSGNVPYGNFKELGKDGAALPHKKYPNISKASD